MILCMTEKPSVAKDVARVLHIDTSKYNGGYFEGNGYIVTWCVGHLVALAEPDSYGYMPQAKTYNEPDKALSELPIAPSEFKFTVIKTTKQQFDVIKKLMDRKDVDRIYDLGDCGNEGVVLQALVRMQAGNGWGFNPKTGDAKKPVYRWNATSMTDEALNDALRNITDPETAQKKYMSVIQAELCKKKADWMLGMTMSRAETALYKTQITVGRVQSPTLAFVVARYLLVKNFKPHNYYSLKSRVTNGSVAFDVFWNADKDGIFAAGQKDQEGRLIDRSAAEKAKADVLQAGTGTVTAYSKEKKMQSAPQFYDSLELQADANKKYGYSAAETLDASQLLYDKYKVITYPRTDSSFITSDMESHLIGWIEDVATQAKYSGVAQELLKTGIETGKRLINDKKVTDHHAILPTSEIRGFDISKIEDDKKCSAEVIRNVLDLILTRFLIAMSSPYKYIKSTVEVQFPNGLKFSATGSQPVSFGWKAAQEALSGKENAEADPEQTEQTFPPMNVGDRLRVEDCVVQDKVTTPPKLHTEATLLKAMLNAGNTIENGSVLKGKGIGTQATRAGIIQELFKREMVQNLTKGKTKYIIPTEKGLSVISILPHDLYSPKITADWETKIDDIIQGKSTPEQFMADFSGFLNQKLQEAKADIKDVSFASKKDDEVVGKCPFCKKGDLIVFQGTAKAENDKRSHKYYAIRCSEKCGLTLRTDDKDLDRLKTKCTRKQLIDLVLKDGFVAPSLSKQGKVYSGEFYLTRKENGYYKINCALPGKVRSHPG